MSLSTKQLGRSVSMKVVSSRRFRAVFNHKSHKSHKRHKGFASGQVALVFKTHIARSFMVQPLFVPFAFFEPFVVNAFGNT